jgi:hypothetical protein
MKTGFNGGGGIGGSVWRRWRLRRGGGKAKMAFDTNDSGGNGGEEGAALASASALVLASVSALGAGAATATVPVAGAAVVGGRSIIANASISLLISEGTFVDADDPLLVPYWEAGNRAEGVHCGMSVFGDSETTTNATSYSSMCDIEFIHPGVIDIKQLPFASRQHVITYRVGRLTLVNPSLRRRNRSVPLSLLRGGGGTLEIIVKYLTRKMQKFYSKNKL